MTDQETRLPPSRGVANTTGMRGRDSIHSQAQSSPSLSSQQRSLERATLDETMGCKLEALAEVKYRSPQRSHLRTETEYKRRSRSRSRSQSGIKRDSSHDYNHLQCQARSTSRRMDDSEKMRTRSTSRTRSHSIAPPPSPTIRSKASYSNQHTRGRSVPKSSDSLISSPRERHKQLQVELLTPSTPKVASTRSVSTRRGRSVSESRHSPYIRHSRSLTPKGQREERDPSVDTRSTKSQSRSNSRSRSVCVDDTSFENHIEPNVHENSIMHKEIKTTAIEEMKENELFARKAGISFSTQLGDYMIISESSQSTIQDTMYVGHCRVSPKYKADQLLFDDNGDDDLPSNATFLRGNDEMEPSRIILTQKDLVELQEVAGQISVEWRGKKLVAPALARRLVDFQFAQNKRRKKFGIANPWGIVGLYDYLAGVRADVEWAELAAHNRANGEPYTAWIHFMEERKSGKNRPWFTYLVLLICTVMLVVSLGVNGWVIERLSKNPTVGASAATLLKLGAKDSFLIVNKDEIWRILTPMTLHAGVVHYFLNMLALWFVGPAIEYSHGIKASILVFVVPAIGGTIASAIFLPKYISVGASGGIFGLIGACLADIFLNWKILFSDLLNEGKSKLRRHALILTFLFLDILLNAAIGLTPFVDNFTHLGGMFLGFLCGLSTMERVSMNFLGKFEEKGSWHLLRKLLRRYFGIIISVLAIIGGFIVLMKGDGMTSPCPACNAISCVEFPPWVRYEKRWWHCDGCGYASADVTTVGGLYTELAINCPSGQVTSVFLDDDSISMESLQKNLEKYCHQHCARK